jgi:hypothetical protein
MTKKPEILFFVSSLNVKKSFVSLEVFSTSSEGIGIIFFFSDTITNLLEMELFISATLCFISLFSDLIFDLLCDVPWSFEIGFAKDVLMFSLSVEPLSAHAVNSKVKKSRVVIIFIMMHHPQLCIKS